MKLLWGEQPQPCGGKLKPEGQAIKKFRDRQQVRSIRTVDRHRRAAAPGHAFDQREARRRIQRVYSHTPLNRQAQRGLRGNKEPQVRKLVKQRRKHWRDREQVLQVIEHQQRRTALSQPPHHSIPRRSRDITIGADRCRHRREHVIWRSHAGKPHHPYPTGMVVEQPARRHERQSRLADPASPGQTHQPISLLKQRAPHPAQLVLTAQQLRRPGRQVRRTHPLRPRRRKSLRAAPVDHRTEQGLGRRKVLESMQPERLSLDHLARECTRLAGQKQLPTMRRRRNPRRSVHLQTHITRAPTLHIPDMQPHPNPQLTNLLRPPPRPYRPQRAHGHPCGRHRTHKRGEEPITFRAIHKPALGIDRFDDQPVMRLQHIGPPSTKPPGKPRRPLNIGEQQRNRAIGRTRRMHAPSRLTPPPPQPTPPLTPNHETDRRQTQRPRPAPKQLNVAEALAESAPESERMRSRVCRAVPVARRQRHHVHRRSGKGAPTRELVVVPARLEGALRDALARRRCLR